MITATFSNGFTDTYKGQRPVRAAWAIIRTSDNVTINSGHSLDRVKAAKTAEGHLHETARDLGLTGHPLRYFEGRSIRDTAAKRRAKAAHNAERLAFIRSLVRIEIVDL
jgi:hypothetical protein